MVAVLAAEVEAGAPNRLGLALPGFAPNRLGVAEPPNDNPVEAGAPPFVPADGAAVCSFCPKFPNRDGVAPAPALAGVPLTAPKRGFGALCAPNKGAAGVLVPPNNDGLGSPPGVVVLLILLPPKMLLAPVGVAAGWLAPPAAGVVLPKDGKLNVGALLSLAVVVGVFPKSEGADVVAPNVLLPKEKPAGLLASAIFTTGIDALQGCKLLR